MTETSDASCSLRPDSNPDGPIVVLVSGGVDSITMLHLLRSQGHRLTALFVDYAQRASIREYAAAQQHCAALGVDLLRLDLTQVGQAFRSRQVAKLHIPLPHRNVVVLSLALSYAGQVHASAIATAVIKDDVGGYASASVAFLDAMQNVASALGGVNLMTPLIQLTKTDVIRAGVRLGVDFTQTHSCMRDNDRHCGRCTQCVRRRDSFRAAGVSEPEGFYAYEPNGE